MADPEEKAHGVDPEHLARVLNQHGFSFQYAVANTIIKLSSHDRWSWNLEAVEVPVEVKGKPTHVDILMKHSMEPMYLVAECKRVNPRLSNWVFLKAPYGISSGSLYEILVESVQRDKAVSSVRSFGSADRLYHLPFELKAAGEGASSGDKGRGAIEDAATQVMRHLNGFVALLDRFSGPTSSGWGASAHTWIMPVIFTTARLFTCDANLANSDPVSGDIDLQGSTVKEIPWLYYQYNQSPGLKHELKPADEAKRLTQFVTSEFVRTIAVVNAHGIEDFLRSVAGLP